jgi:hypothetical protein
MFVIVRGNVFTDSAAIPTELPVLLTPSGVLEPLLDYLLARRSSRSLAWSRTVARSVQLFVEYLQSNPQERDTYLLFQNFAQRLYTGTIERNTGEDPTGLWWTPSSPDVAARVVSNLSGFFDYLGKTRPEAAKINPKYEGDAYDRLTDEAAYQYRRSKAFLGHTWAAHASPAKTGYLTRVARPPKVERSEPPAFPDERFEELLFKGFCTGSRPDYRGMLITLLLHGAGFRESEPFHLYISDVFPDPANRDQAKVLIHHPRFGAAPADWRDASGKAVKGNRAEYLASMYGLPPRTHSSQRKHAGWKGGTHDGRYYKQAYWFLPEYGKWFLSLWHKYLEQVARIERSHPFAFINVRREPVGGMYTIGQYNKAHAAACRRIGMEVSKALGTTPHGHRHAYGRRVTNAGLDKEHIRRFMHHISLESQDVYTKPTTLETLTALKAAGELMQSTSPVTSQPEYLANECDI